MLSQTIDEIMTRAKKFEHLTRATKFGSAFKNTNKKENDGYLMHKRISRYSEKVQSTCSAQNDWELTDIIVEDPEEIKVKIEYKNNSNNMPFFRSIEAKLSKKLQHQA